MVCASALAFKNDMNTQVAATNTRLSDLAHAFPEHGLRWLTEFVVAGRFLQHHHLSGPVDAHLPGPTKMVHQFPTLRRPQSCSLITSCGISLSKPRSATIRFRRLSSSSSCFKRRNSDGISPAYFLRHRQCIYWEMPAFLQASSIPTLSSACFKIKAICCCVNLDFFIVFPRYASLNITRKFSLQAFHFLGFKSARVSHGNWATK